MMVLIIMSPKKEHRDSVSKYLAESLGWELSLAEDLAHASITAIETQRTQFLRRLATELGFWTYDWRDVVLSCPELNENERTRLCKEHPMLRIICLGFPEGTERTIVGEQAQQITSSSLIRRKDSGTELQQVFLGLGSSKTEEVIAQTALRIIVNAGW